MDNFVTSVADKESPSSFVHESTELLSEAKLKLGGWESNRKFGNDIKIAEELGVFLNSDLFGFQSILLSLHKQPSLILESDSSQYGNIEIGVLNSSGWVDVGHRLGIEQVYVRDPQMNPNGDVTVIGINDLFSELTQTFESLEFNSTLDALHSQHVKNTVLNSAIFKNSRPPVRKRSQQCRRMKMKHPPILKRSQQCRRAKMKVKSSPTIQEA